MCPPGDLGNPGSGEPRLIPLPSSLSDMCEPWEWSPSLPGASVPCPRLGSWEVWVLVTHCLAPVSQVGAHPSLCLGSGSRSGLGSGSGLGLGLGGKAASDPEERTLEHQGKDVGEGGGRDKWEEGSGGGGDSDWKAMQGGQ